MHKNLQGKIDERWIKASIVGTTWAASEIVLGSFLHNLKIPFSGNILTAIGLIILISVSFIWKDKGLIWRAGLICALMKTMSPSAVIFGPMIAIFSESVLLELSVRLFRRTVFGFLLGAMLAMVWNLFQKIINFIIFYGFNIVALYTDLIKYAQKNLHIESNIIWLPIIILLAIYSLFGLIAAAIGIKIGRKLIHEPLNYLPEIETGHSTRLQPQQNSAFNYSLAWLFFNMAILITGLALLNLTWIYWTSTIPIIVTLWAWRYKRALRQLSKPKFWMFFVLITMITAVVFSKMQPELKELNYGLLIGIQMNFRAVLVIVGFSVLGTELYNPRIRNFFRRTSFKQLPMSLELAFASLPSMIAHIPDLKTIIKNPISVIYQIIGQAEYRLSEIKKGLTKKVFILTGKTGQGKTSFIIELIIFLKKNEIAVGGIYSPRIIENNETKGYDLVDIVSNHRTEFLRKKDLPGFKKVGRYSILPKGLQFGKKVLSEAQNNQHQIILIDEIGKLELENDGWADNLEKIVFQKNTALLIVVRDSLVEEVTKKWSIENPTVFHLEGKAPETVGNEILKHIR